MSKQRKLEQKKKRRAVESRAKVLKKRTKLRAEARLQYELDRIRKSMTEKIEPIVNKYETGVAFDDVSI